MQKSKRYITLLATCLLWASESSFPASAWARDEQPLAEAGALTVPADESDSACSAPGLPPEEEHSRAKRTVPLAVLAVAGIFVSTTSAALCVQRTPGPLSLCPPFAEETQSREVFPLGPGLVGG